ncbi:hypothetical protein H8356DRAFT_1350287 [Neocallimastix lanati (nom. inval.)]|nr:hypothetical protein H8356DRAFT_1350287 [Neocallimastix sp. JGI-2020a]
MWLIKRYYCKSYWAYTDCLEIRYVTKELSLDRLEVTIVARESIGLDRTENCTGESRETENFITSRMKTAQESKTPRKSITATYIIRGS